MIKIFFFNFILLCSPMIAYAQTAEEIIEKHLIAKGGSALDSIKSATMEVEVSSENAPGMKSGMTYNTIMMKSHRIDVHIPYMYDAVICFSGNSGWSSMKFGDKNPEITLIDSAEVQDLKYQTEILGPLYHYKEKGYKVAYLGKEKVNEVESYNIKINAANNTTYNCYIDTVNYTEIKRTIIAPSNGQMITVDLYYSMIKPVIGVMMPFKIEMHNKKGIMYFDFVKIILNCAIEEKLFDIPSGH